MSRQLRRLRLLAVIVVLYSLFQYGTTGTVSWPASLYDRVSATVGERLDSPRSGWRRAAETVESLGAKREGRSAPGQFDLTGVVVRVADGDTLSLLDRGGQQHKVRLFGIDTPERDQPHGDAARRALAGWVDNREVGVVVVETDDYGRTVGTVYRGGENINLAMVANGHAWWYRYYAPHERALQAAEERAREQRLGLWQRAHNTPPWDWRRGQRR